MPMKTRTPSGPVSKRTPRMKPSTRIGTVRARATTMSATRWPSRIDVRDTGVSSNRSR